MHFGPDGKLYVAVGENANRNNAADAVGNLLGKMLRINADGTIPTDNPFFTQATRRQPRDLGARAAQSVHLRVPARHRARMFINDVGEDTWEEINDGIAGSNYGWPTTEGTDDRPAASARRCSPTEHGSSSTTGCAITGGAFYNPTTAQFPSIFRRQVFLRRLLQQLDSRLRSRPRTPPASRRGCRRRRSQGRTATGCSTTSQRGGSPAARSPHPIRAEPSAGDHAQPANRTVAAGQQATFSVDGVGQPSRSATSGSAAPRTSRRHRARRSPSPRSGRTTARRSARS